LRRILEALDEEGAMKKTRLALKTGLNYNNCLRYLHLLKVLGWVTVSNTHDSERDISITALGRNMRSRVSHLLLNSRPLGADAESVLELSKLLANASPEEAHLDSLPLDDSKQQKSKESIPHKQVGAQAVMNGSKKMDDTKSKPAGKNAICIMLIDDEEDVLVTYESILSDAGYSVESFSVPEKALVRIAAVEPSYFDLVSIDIRMPGINGLQLYQRMKAISPDTKFIFISSVDAAKELVSVLPEVDLDDVVKKPIDKARLVEKVRSTIHKQAA
jgi:CheY-like chemotaxis protein/predicted transcriptional regulator